MRAVLGVIGHVDHGKTALVRALTGMETDRLEEEKRRGISIALGFAHLTIGDATIDLIDMPGHERFVRTMVSGATGVDAVLLVVAANEGIQPQTAEHVDIAGLLGLRRAILAITKADLVPEAQAHAVAAQAATLLQAAGLTVEATVTTSATAGTGLGPLAEALRAIAASQPAQEDAGFAYLPIDRAFSIAGQGTIVTGTLRRGPLSLTDTITLAPSGQKIRLRALQVHGTRTTQALPGQRVAANLRDIPATDIARGAALCTNPGLEPSTWLTTTLQSVSGAAPLPNNTRLVLLFGTEETEIRLRLLDRDELRPGDQALAQLKCATPVAIPARERFILRRASPPLTLAGGQVIDPAATRLRRHAPMVLARLRILAGATPKQIVAAEANAAGTTGTALARLAGLAGVSEARAADALQSAAFTIGRSRIVVATAAYNELLTAIPTQLGPTDATLETLATHLPGTGRLVLEMAIADLVRAGTIVQAGGTIRLPARDRARSDSEATAAAALAETIRAAGLSPPDPTRLVPGPQTRRLVDRLVREGTLVRALDTVQKREIFFHMDAVEAAKRVLAPLLTGSAGILVGEAGIALGISRKFCVPLLEHLDAIRFTTRIGDRRILRA